MAQTSKFYKQQRYVSYDSGNTWTALNEFRKGALIENNSIDCGGSQTTYEKWEAVSGEYVCDNANKYQKERKYELVNNVWTPTDNYRKGELIQANSSDCGYMETWQTMSIDTYWICDGGNKYHKQEKMVSRDSGSTWTHTNEYRKGTIYQQSSSDCSQGEPIYQWRTLDINTDYECNGVDKHYKEQKYESYDNGTTWNETDEYRMGALYQANSEDCGFTPKFKAWYINGTTSSAACNSDTTLTSAITKAFSTSNMVSALVGTCVTTIDNNAFSNCNNLSSVTIPSSVTTIGKFVFYNTSALERIDIPSSVTSIGQGALSQSGVKEINIEGSGLTELPSDFAVNCYSLSSVTIPSGVTVIGRGAFYGCSSLSSVTIPNGVGGIQQDAFNGCSNLKTLTLPESIEVLRNGTFMNCDNLESVTLEARLPRQVPYVETDVSNPTFSLTASYPFYVNSNLVSYFKNDTYWSAYADRIQAIS